MHTASVWLAARGCVADDQDSDDARPASGTLGVAVEFKVPWRSPLRLPTAFKALLDGIVCSFHRHNGHGDLDELAARVTAQLKGSIHEEQVKRLLTTGPSELGARRLLHAWGGSVQWNPADDELVVIEARLVRSDTDTPACQAKLVQPRPAEGLCPDD